ncbi:MAG TPA: acyl carrier protein [Vicinamibacterales bacterium]|jgi:acyl carrier protein|nr:acyl carrier protein [Vicinamibacterales bacterium]
MLIELEDVCRTVGLVLGRRAAKADDRLMEDLGAESMDVLGVMVTLEEKYGVTIDEAAMAGVSTVRDLYDVVLKSPHARNPAADPPRSA